MLHVIHMSFACALMSLVCQYSLILFYMSFVSHSYMLVCDSYVIRMLLVCPGMLPYVTRMYSYAIRISLVCSRISPVSYSYLLLFHRYVTRLWFYHEPSLGENKKIVETRLQLNLPCIY